jgi:HTH-type transcriptional regulator / antitoxin MqsA
MKCPNCGGAELQPDTRDMAFTYKSQTLILPAIAGAYCPVCGEGIFDAHTSRVVANK